MPLIVNKETTYKHVNIARAIVVSAQCTQIHVLIASCRKSWQSLGASKLPSEGGEDKGGGKRCVVFPRDCMLL